MRGFPNEIWEHIFSNFEAEFPELPRNNIPSTYHSSYDTLHALGLVCKRFQEIAERCIYRSILIQENDEHGRLLQRLLASKLETNPQLGQHVRRLWLQGHHGKDIGNFAFTKRFLTAVAPLIAAPPNLKKAILDHMRMTAQELRSSGDPYESTQTLILLLTPRVRSLSINLSRHHFYVEQSNHVIRWLLSSTFQEDGDYHQGDFDFQSSHKTPPDTSTTPPRSLYLHDLEELVLRNDTCEFNYHMGLYEGVLLHPKLKVLRLERFCWLSDVLDSMRWGEVNSRLTRLELHDCSLDPDSLKHILTRCSKLQHLAIDLGGPSKRSGNYEVDVDEFGKVLKELGKSLITLMFSTRNHEESSWKNLELSTVTGCIGSLKEFTSLEHLTITRKNLCSPSGTQENHDNKMIYLHDALPKSLTTLQLIAELDDYHTGHDGIEWSAFNIHTDVQICELIQGRYCPDLNRIDITRIVLPDLFQSGDIDDINHLGDDWHVTWDENEDLGGLLNFHKTMIRSTDSPTLTDEEIEDLY